MNKHPLISIIVTVYNLEQYLDKCLSSIHSQTYTNWECIVIDDNSQDNSGKIAKKWRDKDPRFSYIYNEENKGASQTRNIGIEHAQGDFILFIDADDWVEKRFLQDFFPHIENNKTLIVQDLIVDFPEHSIHKAQNYKNEQLFFPNDLKKFLSNYKYTQSYTWNRLFCLSIIRENDIRFISNITNEDEVFCMEYIKYINSILFIENANYHYVQRKKSLSRTIKFIPLYNFINPCMAYINYFKTFLNQTEDSKEFIENYEKRRFNALFLLALRNAIYLNNYSKKERLNFLKMLRQSLKEYKHLYIPPKTIFQKIDIFLLKNNLLHLLDFLLKSKIKQQ